MFNCFELHPSLAYLEFIFLMGRYPFIGGSISLMFYYLLSHLFRSLINFVVLVVGFAFGFFIISQDKGGKSAQTYFRLFSLTSLCLQTGDHFENPAKAILKTLIMALGEFEFDDLYSAHADDVFSLAFTMALLGTMLMRRPKLSL